MTDLFSDDHLIMMVPGLTPDRLLAFVEAQLVVPTIKPANDGMVRWFTVIDIARLQLLCELADDLGLDEASLGVVIALVDKLHAARNDLQSIMRAIEAESPEVRARIGGVLIRSVP